MKTVVVVCSTNTTTTSFQKVHYAEEGGRREFRISSHPLSPSQISHHTRDTPLSHLIYHLDRALKKSVVEETTSTEVFEEFRLKEGIPSGS